MITGINEGDTFLCKKDVIISQGEIVAFKAGRTYTAHADGFITDSWGFGRTGWDKEAVNIHFDKVDAKPVSYIDSVLDELNQKLEDIKAGKLQMRPEFARLLKPITAIVDTYKSIQQEGKL